MPQDKETKHAYEHTAKMHHQEREEAKGEDALNAARLQADQHTGQQSVVPPVIEDRNAEGEKGVYEMLHQAGWHKDEIRRVLLVPVGTRLKMGGTYLDLRNTVAGELTAHGEEEVHAEWLVAKHDADYEIWNKLKALH